MANRHGFPNVGAVIGKLVITIVNNIINFCYRFLQKPYMAAFARPKVKFLMSLTINKKITVLKEKDGGD